MNVRHLMGVLHCFSIKNIFYDKINLRLFCFCVTKCAAGSPANNLLTLLVD